ncbi:unnamed protein product [Urochloa humidicola]
MAEQPGATGDDKASAREKLQRLEMLLIKIHAALEVSKKHAAVGRNSRLVQCRDALKEAASEGDEALAFFTRRAVTVTRSSNEELGDAASSPAAGSLFFTWSALSPAMAWRVRDSSKNILFSGDDDTKRLDTVVEKLEQLSPDVEEFIRLLQLEILPKMEQTWPLTRKSAPPPCLLPSPPHYGVEPRWPAEWWIADSPGYEDYRAWVALLQRLSALVVGGRIEWAVRMMWGRDMDIGGGGSGVLAQGAAILREADQRGWAILLNADRCLAECSCFYGDEPPPRCALGRARDQVRQVVRGLEILAFQGDVESFGGLANCTFFSL